VTKSPKALAAQAAIGRRIRDRRIELGLTQARLAELADMFPAEISDIELGRRGLTTDRMVDLLAALGGDANEILGLAAAPAPGRSRKRKAARAHAKRRLVRKP
jgi:transcriptional regulator with XRE-family HTH domain